MITPIERHQFRCTQLTEGELQFINNQLAGKYINVNYRITSIAFVNDSMIDSVVVELEDGIMICILIGKQMYDKTG